MGSDLNALGCVGRRGLGLGKLPSTKVPATDLGAVGAAQLAVAIGLVVSVAAVKLAIGAAQDAEAVHLAVGPLAFEPVGGIGGQDARAIETPRHGLAV